MAPGRNLIFLSKHGQLLEIHFYCIYLCQNASSMMTHFLLFTARSPLELYWPVVSAQQMSRPPPTPLVLGLEPRALPLSCSLYPVFAERMGPCLSFGFQLTCSLPKGFSLLASHTLLEGYFLTYIPFTRI